jgi:alpha-ketoglutarate-dependent taurine dioxygenase
MWHRRWDQSLWRLRRHPWAATRCSPTSTPPMTHYPPVSRPPCERSKPITHRLTPLAKEVTTPKPTERNWAVSRIHPRRSIRSSSPTPAAASPCCTFNAGFTTGIVGWTREESMALLNYLYQHATQDRFVRRFQWRSGSMAIWDNRCTWHHALNDYQGHHRLMHRITLEGGPLS